MCGDVTRSVSGVILLAGLIGASCSDVPTEPTPSTKAQALSIAAEPTRVTPEFLPSIGPSCGGQRAFRTRFAVILAAVEGLQTLDVSFTDRSGVFVAPAVVPASDLFTGSMMTSPPIRLPTSTPIPFPTTLSNIDLSMPAGTSQRLPVTLEFGCHVQPLGTILITAGTRDHRGQRGEHRLAIEVANR
jgi:hypothetical protein